jgi:hypothetical protein
LELQGLATYATPRAGTRALINSSPNNEACKVLITDI